MYLASLSITDYKNFHPDFEINLSKGLNVLVGENGVGKSAIIDAIRLLTLEDEFGRNLISESAFHEPFDTPNGPAGSFEIRGTFGGLTREELVAFLPWTDGTQGASLTLHVENKLTPRGHFKWDHWGGASRSSAFEKELFEAIDCVYLPPLRDAEAKLREGRGSRLARLLRSLNAKKLKSAEISGELHPLEAKVKDFNKSLAQEPSIKTANDLIQQRLRDAIGNVFGQGTLIQYSQSNFTRIVERLRLLFYPDVTIDAAAELFRSLDQNSMGYNNLLYVATVLAELDNDADDPQYLKLLLIEEPEAHLHPQLQTKLLKYLEAKATEKNVQIIVTTHSPVLASAVSIESLIHLSLSENTSGKAVSIRECGLAEESVRFISRWLDVTKSVLLFAKGVILVEGIAEALVLPELAKRVLRIYNNGRTAKVKLPDSLEEAGVSVINMGGVYFKHFMQLFCDVLGSNHEPKIPIRCAGITDKDPPKESTPSISSPADGTNPALELIPIVNTSKWARLYSGQLKTFEYDLAMEEGNMQLMFEVAQSLLDTDGPIRQKFAQYAGTSWSAEDDQSKTDAASFLLDRIEKGEFSQALADRLSNVRQMFVVPDYIRKAVIWACGEDPDESPRND